MSAPERLTIVPDDYHAQDVGIAADGRQFFLTTPFVPGGSEYVALYLWTPEGEFDQATILGFGPRETLDLEARRAARDDLLAGLGAYELAEISVAPFSTEFDGERFGLIPTEYEGITSVNALPGDYMAFFEPWDLGEYDT